MDITKSDFASFLLIVFLLLGGIGPFFGPGAKVATAQPDAKIQDCIDRPLPYSDRTQTEEDTVIELQQTDSNNTSRLVVQNPPSGLVLRIPPNFESEYSNPQGFDVRLHQARVDGEPDIASVLISAAKTEYSESGGTAAGNILIPLPKANTDVYYKPAEEGYVGRQFALLGPYRMTNRTVGCQKLRVITPGSSSGYYSDLRRPSVIDRLETASREIGIGRRHDIVTTFIAPAPFQPALGYVPSAPDSDSGASEIVLSPSITRTSGPIVMHEYIHTAQSSVGSGWVSEGQATYLAQEHAIYAEYMTPRAADETVMSMFNSTTGKVVGGMREEYARGYLFFAQLDRKLVQRGSNLETLLRRINHDSFEGGNQYSAAFWEGVAEDMTNDDIELNDPYADHPEMIYWMDGDTPYPEIRLFLAFLGQPLMREICLVLLPFSFWTLWSNRKES